MATPMDSLVSKHQLNPQANTVHPQTAMDFQVRDLSVIFNSFNNLAIGGARSSISSFGGSNSVEATNSIYAQDGGYSSGGPSAVPDTIQQSYDSNGGYNY